MAFLQIDVASKEAWQNEVVGATGLLLVCDLYADWAGPCKSVKETFKKLYIDHGEGAATLPLKFVTVNVDKVPALEQFKGKCQPMFLFYRDGRQLDKVEGVEIPKLAERIGTLSKKQAA